MRRLGWEPVPFGRGSVFADVPDIGRYLIRYEGGRGKRRYHVTLNGKPIYVEHGTLDFIKEQVQRAVDAVKVGELNQAAVSTRMSPLPKAADLTRHVRILLEGGAPPWVQKVEQRGDHTICVLTEGRVFEVTVR
jgi:hypothetical protein